MRGQRVTLSAALPKLCPQPGDPLLERGNDVIADFGLRESDPVYKPTPTIDLIFGADDHFIGIAIHGDQALRLFDLVRQISDSYALVSIVGLSDRAHRCSKVLPEARWQQVNDPRRLIDQALSVRTPRIVVEHAEEAELVRRAADRIAGWRGPQSRGTEVRRLAGGGRWIRTFGSPTDPLPFRDSQAGLPSRFDLPTRNRWFESTSLQRRVRRNP
jgi:hypothetical protein